MKSTLLIDLSSLYWANWHATADQPIGEAFDRTVARVHSLRSGYDYVACCIDSPPYFRKELHPEYKAQRDKPTPQSLEQFARVKERLQADGVLLLGAKGYEADDIAATAVARLRDPNMAIVLATADKDWFSLVSDTHNVRVLSTTSGMMYDRNEVITKLGVAPDMVADWLALMGDKSDNVPGVPGVGPKTAAKLLLQYGSLHEVLANADKQTEKLCAALIEHAGAARLARQLVELKTDAAINVDELFEERKQKPLKEAMMPGRDDGFDEREEADDDAGYEEMISKPKAPSEPPPPAAVAPAPEPKSEPRAAAPKLEEPKKDALAKTQPAGEWSLLLEPRNLKQAWWLAEQMANSRLFAKFASAEQAYMVMLRGRALGLDAVTAASAFHNIDGQLAMHADLIEALVLRSGLAEYFDLVETTRQRATYATKRKGARREVSITFTIEDAFHAQLVEKHASGIDGYRGISKTGKASNWDKVRPTMLRHRAKTQLCRAVYADVVLGLYSPDELSDGRDIIDADFEAA